VHLLGKSNRSQDGRCDKEIKRRIGISKNIFHNIEKVLTSRAINMSTKLCLLKCYTCDPLYCTGCESCTVSQRMKSQLEAIQKCGFTSMLRIAWTDKVSNEEVLHKGNTSRNLLKVIVNTNRLVGHVVKKSQLEAIALTGMIEGKRARA